MTTCRKIITASLRKAGIITMNETPTDLMANNARDALNNMVSSWSNSGVNVFARKWLTVPIQSGQAVYTIYDNPAADIETPRPQNIASAYVVQGGITYPLGEITDEAYSQIAMKSITGVPQWFNYDNGYPIGRIRLWPLAGGSYTLSMLNEDALESYGLDDNIDLPAGWERAIIFNLCQEICGDYGQEVPESVSQVAQKSFRLIRDQIARVRALGTFPSSGGGARNNIYSGWMT